jgi:hypothetical protein
MENNNIRVDLTQAPWLECGEKNKLFEVALHMNFNDKTRDSLLK